MSLKLILKLGSTDCLSYYVKKFKEKTTGKQFILKKSLGNNYHT